MQVNLDLFAGEGPFTIPFTLYCRRQAVVNTNATSRTGQRIWPERMWREHEVRYLPSVMCAGAICRCSSRNVNVTVEQGMSKPLDTSNVETQLSAAERRSAKQPSDWIERLMFATILLVGTTLAAIPHG